MIIKNPSNIIISNYSLENIRIPNNVTSISDWAYLYYQHLKRIDISGDVNYIDASTFNDCINLICIKLEGTTPPVLVGLLPNNENLKIYVPNEALNVYKTASNWLNYADKIIGY